MFTGVLGQDFTYHGEIYVKMETTQDDIGLYEVNALDDVLSGGQLLQPHELDFIVTPPGNINNYVYLICIVYIHNCSMSMVHVVDANTTSNSEPVVMVVEGNSVYVSCTSTGAPTPSMTWEVSGETTPFMQFDTTEATQARIVRDAMGNFVPDISVGSISSDLTITNAQYPYHDGVYTCIGSNDKQMMTTSALSITVIVVSK